MRPEDATGCQKVFCRGIPKMETLHRDLEKAAVAIIDSLGRKAGFYTFRRTFDTHLNLNGANPTGTMHLMPRT